MAQGAFAWTEPLTRDVDSAKRFYAGVFGWSFEPSPMFNPMFEGATYWVAKLAGEPVTGIMATPQYMPPETPPHWLTYFEVDDVDLVLKQVVELAGKQALPPFDVPDVGRFGFVMDSTAAALAFLTPLRKA